jgi:predicted small metal-binding protein
MSRVNDWSIQLNAEMDAEIFQQIPEHLRDQIKTKKIDYAHMKPIYKKDKLWNDVNDQLKELYKTRAEIEARIRAEQ